MVTLPSVSKVVSRLPLVLYRTTAKSSSLSEEIPAAMIFPSGCTTTEYASSSVLLPMSVVTLPSVSKVVSRLPLALYRTTTKSSPLPGRVCPATMIFPSDWSATDFARSSLLLMPMLVVTLPSVSKVVSRLPLGLYRTTAKSSEPLPYEPPAKMIFPSVCSAIDVT